MKLGSSITSNTKMKGVVLTKKDGAIKDSIIKTNYIFTIAEFAVKKNLFTLNKAKKSELYEELMKNLSGLK